MTSERKERSPGLSRTTQPADARRAAAAARRRAAALAGHTGDIDAALRGLADPRPEVRATALRALTRLDQASPEVVRAAADDADPLVRVAACEAAVQLPEPDAVAIVGPLLDASSEGQDLTSVVEAAAFAAGELGAEAGPLVPRITRLMDHADPIVRETAVAALGAIGDPAALPTILAGAKDRATVRRRAIIALAPFEGPDVDEALAAALDDRDWQVRQAAEDQTEPHEETHE